MQADKYTTVLEWAAWRIERLAGRILEGYWKDTGRISGRILE
jgi:hypothetical protein